MLYNTFILLHITYGIQVFGAAPKTFMNPTIMIRKEWQELLLSNVTDITQILYFSSKNC